MSDALFSEVTKAELAHRGWRMVKDRLFGLVMGVGGVTVIVALVTIFFYLLWVVVPLFRAATLSPAADVALPADVVHLSTNEHGDVLFTVAADGSYRFVGVDNGKALVEGSLVPAGARIEAGVGDFRSLGVLALGLDGGRAVVAKPVYRISFPSGVRSITPALSWPVGAEPIALTAGGAALARVAVASADERTTIAAAAVDGTLRLTHLAPAEGLLLDDEAPSFETTSVEVAQLPAVPDALLVDGDQQELYVLAGREIGYWNIRDKEKPKLVETVQLVPPDVEVTELRFLAGGHSLLVGDSRGRITQWFPVRDEANNFRLTRIREFTAFTQPVRRIAPEWFRKGFVAIDAGGTLGVFHATAERTLLTEATGVADALALAISPRADTVLAAGHDGSAKRYALVNEHPEVSWRSLWGKVWYEGRAQPEFIWQSSSASSDFEPKFSLTPLAFGTIKAAFYALFFAVPLAILGAIYTAYFMHPKLRAVVKPSIEIMAALPTVILGFLAGLWLAPIIESHLIGVFLAMLLMPLSVGLASFAWSWVPAGLRRLLPPGREVLLIVPLLVGALALAMAVSQPLEQIFFDGNLPRWLGTELGMSYDQRNSLVVGIAMGFAVIPNIFSISEDAI
ncbi:MAG: phosphate ABC transporter permease, partial [Gammaproteobacteria bacterium]